MTYFTRKEFLRSKKAVEFGIENEFPEQHEAALKITMAGCERIRAFLGERMIISSGFRCPELNRLVGGSENSQHTVAEAVDFTCPDFGTPEEIAKALKPALVILGIDNLVLEGSWVHMSFTLEPRHKASRYLGSGQFDTL